MQYHNQNDRKDKILKMAEHAGFDEAVIKKYEANFVDMFDSIIKGCAQSAALQSRNFSDGDGAMGCQHAHSAILAYGNNVGHKERPESVIGTNRY